ncbi:hypothetical protein JCM10212_000840 [Sporobolomyces blumeae]
MLLTSPLAVTLGLSLTIPLAIVGDVYRLAPVSVYSIVGGLLVLGSFVANGLMDLREAEETGQVGGGETIDSIDSATRIEGEAGRNRFGEEEEEEEDDEEDEPAGRYSVRRGAGAGERERLLSREPSRESSPNRSNGLRPSS